MVDQMIYYNPKSVIEGIPINIDFEYVVLQPIPNPPTPDLGAHAYIERVPREILSAVKELII